MTDEKKKDVSREQESAFSDSEVEGINLERYFARRHPRKSSWISVLSMIAMLAALIMIMLYKESCGKQVSEFMGEMETPQPSALDNPSSQPIPATSIKLPEELKKSKKSDK